MNKRAFTLIELLITIVIVGILAVVSVAQYQKFQKNAQHAKLISALVEYQNLFERYFAQHGTYPLPSTVDTWYCLANYGSQDVCFTYSIDGSSSGSQTVYGDSQLRETLLNEIDAEFEVPSFILDNSFDTTVQDSLVYIVSTHGKGYALLFHVDTVDFDCTRLRGLIDHFSLVLTNNKNSWTQGGVGGGSSCFYAIREGKPSNYFDIWN